MPIPQFSLAGATIAFDLDGTLVDTAPDLIGTLNVLLEQEGLPPFPIARARPFIGRGARWMIETGFDAAGAPLHPDRVPALFDRFIARYLSRIADESRPFPGCEAALDHLKARGARLVVCTNKRTDLSVALLKALGLARRFDAVIGADAAPPSNPTPDISRPPWTPWGATWPAPSWSATPPPTPARRATPVRISSWSASATQRSRQPNSTPTS